MEYVHVPEGEEIQTAAGVYQITEEVLEYKGKRVLYVRSEAQGPVISCCGGGCLAKGSIFVKGWLIEGKSRREDGKLVSEVEPITDVQEQQEIMGILSSKYPTGNVYF